jgi:hypothetical protein
MRRPRIRSIASAAARLRDPRLSGDHLDRGVDASGIRNRSAGRKRGFRARAEHVDETLVTSETPPTFLFHTNADTAVPVENSIHYFLALGKPAYRPRCTSSRMDHTAWACR